MFEAAELDQRVSKEEFEKREPALRAALLEAQTRLAESAASVVMVMSGAEGAGKGETVNTLLEWLDARGVEVHALGVATTEEVERPPLYQFWRRLPPAGKIAIFFGSWYTMPIVSHAAGDASDDRLERELDRIVDFERMLADEGVALAKCWLHITRERQRKVFDKLESNPDTAWRVTKRDWQFHDTYDAFVETSSRALRTTDHPCASWHVIAARNRRYRELAVGEMLLGAMEKRLAQPARTFDPEPPPVPADLNIINSIDLTPKLSRSRYDQQLRQQQGRIGRLSRRLSASDRSVVLVFEGADAAGKGGAIRRITHALDARWYRVIPIAAPTDEERARPYLWRFWRQLPGRGSFTIFDRSWYGRVLVERVENLCAPQAWARAYLEINEFEEQLVESGFLVFKFWLSISSEEQLRRFQDRRRTPYKQYKITEEDWRNRAKWLAYEAAASDMVERTSTEIAPWTLVSAEDKYHARIRVLDTIGDGLERAVGPDERASKKRRKRKRKSD